MQNACRKFLILILMLCSNISFASPDKFIYDTTEKVLQTARSNLNEAEKERILTEYFIDVMDIQWIAKFVLGKHWAELTNPEQEKYNAAYKSYLINSYVPLFRRYNGKDVSILRIENLNAKNFSVKTTIEHEGKMLQIEYRITAYDQNYKIRDIIAEGISMLQTQRSEFAAVIAEGGVESLISKLQLKGKNP